MSENPVYDETVAATEGTGVAPEVDSTEQDAPSSDAVADDVSAAEVE